MASRFFSSRFRWLALALSGLAITMPVLAKRPNFPPVPAGYRAGMEVELTAPHLAKLMPFFDLAALQNESQAPALPDDFFDDYLRDHPEALDSLPSELREKLTAGLHLESTVEKAEAPKLEAPKPLLPERRSGLIQPERAGLLGADGQSPQRTGLLGADGRPLRDAPQAEPRFQETQGLLRPKSYDWQTLHQRWQALPAREKAKLARWPLLSPVKQAVLALAASTKGSPLKLKKGLPQEIADFFGRLAWHRDGDALEFTHARPVNSPSLLWDDIEKFGRLAGVESKLLNSPESRIQGVTLHYHMSVKGQDYNANEIAARTQKLVMLQRLQQGIISDLAGGDHTYSDHLEVKGLTRLVAEDRIEYRDHPLALRESLPFFTEIQTLPTAEAEKRLNREIQRLLTDEVVDRILSYRPTMLDRFEEFLTPDQQRRRIAAENNWVKSVADADRNRRLAALETMSEAKNWPIEFWEKLPALLDKSDDNFMVRRYAKESVIRKRRQMPASFYEAMQWPKVKNSWILDMLKVQDEFPEAFWKKVIDWLRYPDGSDELIVAKEILARNKKWTTPVWEAVLSRISAKPQPTMIGLLHDQTYWPDSAWRKVSELQLDKSQEVRQAVDRLMKGRSRPPAQTNSPQTTRPSPNCGALYGGRP